ncbi:MAG: hypothetical protein R3Y15_05300 [Rikenellaceae bacterium]
MKDRFEDILKKKLSNQQMAPPLGDFLSLEAELTPVLKRQRHRAVLFRTISSCAAACIIAALVVGGIHRKAQFEPSVDYIAIVEQGPEIHVLADILDDVKSIEPASESTIMAKLSKSIEPETEQEQPQTISQTMEARQTTTPTNYNVSQDRSNNASNSGYNNNVEKRYTSFSLNQDNKQNGQIDFRREARDKGWIADVFIGALASADGDPFSSVSISAMPSQYTLSETISTRNSSDANKTVDNYKHKFPITLGINVGKRIGNGPISIESGLSYSYLESTAQLEATYDYHIKQQIHYIGMPLRARYSFGSPHSKFDFYLSAGGTIEVAVNAKTTTDIYSGSTLSSSITEDLQAKGPLFSAALHSGIAYDIMPRLGLFLEPGVSFYFRNSNHPTTYRTDDNLKFDLRMGIRTRF